MTVRRIFFLPILLFAACGSGDDPAIDIGATTTSSSTTTTAAPSDCSADGHGAPAAQDGLPEPVAETRSAIVAAASACDLDALAAVGPPRYSFGDGGDAAGFWRAEEEAGHEPLRYLVELLDRPHATGPEGHYVWPAAFARESWDAVTPEERDQLRPLYDDDAFEQFAEFGSYVGWRVGITPEGEWAFFVAGD